MRVSVAVRKWRSCLACHGWVSMGGVACWWGSLSLLPPPSITTPAPCLMGVPLL
nr:MAG TPA: Cytochrome C' [Caudoviricetes sp.]